MAFAVKVVQLKQQLNQNQHEYNMADQIQRAGLLLVRYMGRHISQKAMPTLYINLKLHSRSATKHFIG